MASWWWLRVLEPVKVYIAVVYLWALFVDLQSPPMLSTTMHELLGVALGFLLGHYFEASAARYKEGEKHVYDMIAALRGLVVALLFDTRLREVMHGEPMEKEKEKEKESPHSGSRNLMKEKEEIISIMCYALGFAFWNLQLRCLPSGTRVEEFSWEQFQIWRQGCPASIIYARTYCHTRREDRFACCGCVRGPARWILHFRLSRSPTNSLLRIQMRGTSVHPTLRNSVTNKNQNNKPKKKKKKKHTQIQSTLSLFPTLCQFFVADHDDLRFLPSTGIERFWCRHWIDMRNGRCVFPWVVFSKQTNGAPIWQ